jgi:hypothetical protein
MWMDVAALDTKGSVKFVMVTKVNLAEGSRYQVEIRLSPRSMFMYDKLVSVLRFEGSPLAIG